MLTLVSAYVHSGEAGTPKQDDKYRFLDRMTERLPELVAASDHVLVTGDLNVCHTERDLKNWKANRKKAGFLPEERAYFDRFFGEVGYVDVHRRWPATSTAPTRGGRCAARPSTTTRDGASTTTWRPRARGDGQGSKCRPGEQLGRALVRSRPARHRLRDPRAQICEPTSMRRTPTMMRAMPAIITRVSRSRKRTRPARAVRATPVAAQIP